MKLTPNKENSGVQFRSEKNGDYEMKGYQADAGAGCGASSTRKWPRDSVGQIRRSLREAGRLEHLRNLAADSKIRTAINGHLCVDFDDPNGAKQGLIGLQAHAAGRWRCALKISSWN